MHLNILNYIKFTYHIYNKKIRIIIKKNLFRKRSEPNLD